MKPTLRPASVVAFLLILATVPSSLLAPWGRVGHHVVGEIAQRHLTERAAAAVHELIGPETLARVSTWADEMRSSPDDRDYWRRASVWHYISINDDETFETARRNPKGDIMSALHRFERVLRDPRAEKSEKAKALKWIVHLIGDLHQPLHVGRREDRGGNDVLVTWFGEASNLHRVWDTEMIGSKSLSFTEYTEFLDHFDEDQIREWQSTPARTWLQESFDLRRQVYEVGDRRLGFAYGFKGAPIFERRLQQAGIRLAGLLNSIFEK